MLTPIATTEERLRIIHECRQSGLTANEWCRQHGLRWNTYHTWVTRLKKKGLLESAATVPTVMNHEPDLPDIVKVDLTGGRELKPMEYEPNSMWQEPPESEPQGTKAVMEINIGGIRIKATNQVNPQLLAEIIRQIGGVQGC